MLYKLCRAENTHHCDTWLTLRCVLFFSSIHDFRLKIECLLESFKKIYLPLKEGSLLKFKILFNINYKCNDLSKILFTFIGHITALLIFVILSLR